MRRAVRLLDRAARGDQRLGQDLSTEDPAGADVPVPAPVDIVFNPLKVEQLDQGLGRTGHGS